MKFDYTTLFWIATVVFFLSSVILLFRDTGALRGLLFLQIFAGSLMFASSKIGRTFLGLE
jgi:hypothetical protein